MSEIDRNLVLIGAVDSGKSLLSNLILGGEDGKIPRSNNHSGDVKINLSPYKSKFLLRVFETDLLNRNKACLDLLKNKSTDTCFVVVVDVTKRAEFENELVSLKEISKYLCEWSYSLLLNCMVVFTHVDELVGEVDKHYFVRREFKEILSLTDQRYMLVNSTDTTQENRGRILELMVQLSKPSFRIVVYGNTQFQGSRLRDILDIPEHDNLYENYDIRFSLYFCPDHNIARASQVVVLQQELLDIIGHTSQPGIGISVIVILITLTDLYSTDLQIILNRLPSQYALDATNEKYFWNRVIIVFRMNMSEHRRIIDDAIERNRGIRILLIRAGWRYTYTSPHVPKHEFNQRFISLCQRVKNENNFRQVIGGEGVIYRATRDIALRRKEMSITNRIYKFVCRHPLIMVLAITILGSVPILPLFIKTLFGRLN